MLEANESTATDGGDPGKKTAWATALTLLGFDPVTQTKQWTTMEKKDEATTARATGHGVGREVDSPIQIEKRGK